MTPTSTIDLHMHTYYSDGKYSPAELLRYAASIGLETIAITDHDNANGVREAWPLAQELGIELAPAIEFACHWNQCEAPPGSGEIDVLGYFIALRSPDTGHVSRITTGPMRKIRGSFALITYVYG